MIIIIIFNNNYKIIITITILIIRVEVIVIKSILQTHYTNLVINPLEIQKTVQKNNKIVLIIFRNKILIIMKMIIIQFMNKIKNLKIIKVAHLSEKTHFQTDSL